MHEHKVLVSMAISGRVIDEGHTSFPRSWSRRILLIGGEVVFSFMLYLIECRSIFLGYSVRSLVLLKLLSKLGFQLVSHLLYVSFLVDLDSPGLAMSFRSGLR